MSLEATLARISDLNSALSPAPPAQPPQQQAPSTSFAGQLQGAMAPQATASVAPGGGGSMVQIAAGEVGQAESPPGSNNSPRIAMYRSATAGNPGVGPWCAYFVSWACKQAGVPLMDHGQGSGSVDAIYAWAQQSGRGHAVSSGYVPKPGDLIVFNQHIGIVENVLPGGQIQTIEGNSSDRVSRRTHSSGDAIGFVS